MLRATIATHHNSLDARESLTAARPAIPLADCVHSSQCITLACAQRHTLYYFSRMLTAIWRLSPKLRSSTVWQELDYVDKVHKIGCHVNVP